MKISSLEKQEDGSFKMAFDANNAEFMYLATFAINNLIAMGIIKINEDVGIEDSQDVDFLQDRVLN
jgi:hypothetical protein